MKDKNVELVRQMLYNRMETGYKKYGVTTERTDIDLQGWLQNLQEELLDAAVYIERLKDELTQTRLHESTGAGSSNSSYSSTTSRYGAYPYDYNHVTVTYKGDRGRGKK